MFSDQEFIKQCSDPSEFDEEFKEGSDSRSKICAYNIVSSAFKKVIKYCKTKENIDSLTSLHTNEYFEDSRKDIKNMIDFNKKFDLIINTIGFSILKEFNELKPLIDSENLFCHPIHSNLIEIKNKDEGKRIYNKNNANLNIKNSTSNEQKITDKKLKDTYIDKSLPPLKELVKIVALNQDDKMINPKRYEINKIRNFECPRNQAHQKDTLLEDLQNLNMSKSKEEIDALGSPITKQCEDEGCVQTQSSQGVCSMTDNNIKSICNIINKRDDECSSIKSNSNLNTEAFDIVDTNCSRRENYYGRKLNKRLNKLKIFNKRTKLNEDKFDASSTNRRSSRRLHAFK